MRPSVLALFWSERQIHILQLKRIEPSFPDDDQRAAEIRERARAEDQRSGRAGDDEADDKVARDSR